MSAKILIVDDDPNERLVYNSALESLKYELLEAESGPKDLEQCKRRTHDAAIHDLRMPGMDGMELLEQMRARNINTPAVIITAYADVPNAVTARKLGAIDFLKKPIHPELFKFGPGKESFNATNK
jgi:DNA-binding NtrC family response regulator